MAGPARRRRGPTRAPRKVEVRFSEAEYEAIRRAAAHPGRGVSIARYVAEAALTASGATAPSTPRRRPPSHVVLAEIAEATAAVNRVGNNLNQLAREKNSTGHHPAATDAEIARTLTALHRLAATADHADGPTPPPAQPS